MDTGDCGEPYWKNMYQLGFRDSEGRSLQIQDLYSRKNCLDHFLNHHGDVPQPELAEVISSIIMEMTSASSGSGTVRGAVSASRTVTASGGV